MFTSHVLGLGPGSDQKEKKLTVYKRKILVWVYTAYAEGGLILKIEYM